MIIIEIENKIYKYTGTETPIPTLITQENKNDFVHLPIKEQEINEQKKQDKKKEARELIEKKYKEHEQINEIWNFFQYFYDVILTQEQKNQEETKKVKDAKDYVTGILNEYRTKGKDADYTAFYE